MLGAMGCDGMRWDAIECSVVLGCDRMRRGSGRNAAKGTAMCLVNYVPRMLSRPPLDAMPKSIRSYMSSSSSLIHQSSSSCVCTVVAFVGVGVWIWVWFCIVYGCCVISIQNHMHSIFCVIRWLKKRNPMYMNVILFFMNISRLCN